MKPYFLIFLVGVIFLGGVSCNQTQPNTNPPSEVDSGTGTLHLVANGEDFVRQGFISKDEWNILFDHVYVTLSDIKAYQTDPPFSASTGESPTGQAVHQAEPITLDLAEGDAEAPPILISQLTDVPAGHYNALGWHMVQAQTGPATGYTIMLQGQATKAEETINFTLKLDKPYSYNCGEYVGESRKGILKSDGETELEATFHFDHVFGSAETEPDTALNMGAVGFEPFAQLATDGLLDIDQTTLETSLSADDFNKLEDTLASLGHVGEGHCFEATGGYTGHE